MAVKQPSLSSLLAKAKSTYAEAVDTAKANSFVDWADGKYIFLFAGFDIKQSEGATKAWGVTLQWLCAEGERKDDTKYQWIGLFAKDEDGKEDTSSINPFLIPVLEKLSGGDAEDLDITQLETIFEDAVNEKLYFQAKLNTSVSKKNGQEYQNMNLLSLIEGYEPEEAEEEKPAKATPKGKAPAASAKSAVKKKPEPEPEPEEDAPFEEGDEVTFTVTTGKGKAVKTEEYEGVVESVDTYNEECEVVVTTGTGKKATTQTFTVSFDDMEKEEEEAKDPTGNSTDNDEEGESFEEGQEVTFVQEDVEYTGIVKSVDEDEEELVVTVGTGRKAKDFTVSFDEVEPEGEELNVGDTVEYTDPKTKKIVQGKVISIEEDDEHPARGTAKVKSGAVTKEVPSDLLLKVYED